MRIDTHKTHQMSVSLSSSLLQVRQHTACSHVYTAAPFQCQLFTGSQETYNRIIAQSPYGHPMQRYEWGALKACNGWIPIRIGLRQGYHWHAAGTILEKKIVGQRIWYMPRGPITPVHTPAFAAIMEWCRKEAQRKSVVFLKIDPYIPDSSKTGEALKNFGFQSAFKTPDCELQPRNNIVIPLQPGMKKHWEELSRQTRYKIRYAKRQGLSISEEGYESISDFYQLLQETAERCGFAIRSMAYFQYWWNAFGPDGLRLFVARQAGRAAAALWASPNGTLIKGFHLATANWARKYSPGYALLWSAVKQFASEGYDLYDMGGVPGNPTPQHPEWGVYRFKQNLHGQTLDLIGEYDLIYRPATYQLWRLIWHNYRKQII